MVPLLTNTHVSCTYFCRPCHAFTHFVPNASRTVLSHTGNFSIKEEGRVLCLQNSPVPFVKRKRRFQKMALLVSRMTSGSVVYQSCWARAEMSSEQGGIYRRVRVMKARVETTQRPENHWMESRNVKSVSSSAKNQMLVFTVLSAPSTYAKAARTNI